jgi:hypothetical protein
MRNLFFVFLVIPTFLVAQNFSEIRGIVKAEDSGEPIPFVSIYLQGTLLGTVSDLEGVFRLTAIPAPGKYLLVISSGNYQTKFIPVKVDSLQIRKIEIKLCKPALCLPPEPKTPLKSFKPKENSRKKDSSAIANKNPESTYLPVSPMKIQDFTISDVRINGSVDMYIISLFTNSILYRFDDSTFYFDENFPCCDEYYLYKIVGNKLVLQHADVLAPTEFTMTRIRNGWIIESSEIRARIVLGKSENSF